MTETVKLILIESTLIWQPESTEAPAHRVLASLEALAAAGIRLVLLGSSEAAGAAVRALCQSQGVEFASVRTIPTATSTPSLFSTDAVTPAQTRLIARTPELRAEAASLGLSVLPADDNYDWPQLVRTLTARRATIDRVTKETRISGQVDLDATAPIHVSTGIGFFDHMLEQIAKHGGFALELRCEGDLHIDEHHTIEDCALALGDALRRALGPKLGIARYGFLLPMDEAEAQVAIDLSGRAYAVFEGQFGRDTVGGLPTELVPHFFRSLADTLGAALHIQVRGENTHHMIEACFKGVGRALRQAFKREGVELPSTKGAL
jgi:imidazoleglycerol phosphate dehydratase HisB